MSTKGWELAERVVSSMEHDLIYPDVAHGIDRLLQLGMCESPIEAMLGEAIKLYYRIGHYDPWEPLVISSQEDIGHWPKNTKVLVYQYKFKNYRIDWALIQPPHMLFIECDGHEFHERTKEQAARDRKKDRDLQQAGHHVLRFTGSEIYGNATKCARQIFDFMESFPIRSAG